MKELIFMSVITVDDGMERGKYCSRDCQFLDNVSGTCRAFPRADENMERYGLDSLGMVPLVDGHWLRLQACKHNAAKMRAESQVFRAAKDIQRFLAKDRKLEEEWLAMCEAREARRG